MIARHLSFFAPALVMSAWATVMLHTLATGRIKDLLSPMFRDYVLVASVLLVVLSLLYLLLYQPAAETTFVAKGWLRQLGRWFMLLVPVLAASVLSPSALSSTTIQNRSLSSTVGAIPMPTWNSTSQANATAALEADPSQPVPVEVTDLLTLSQTPAQIKAFAGRKVRVIGYFITPPGGTPKLVRFMMWCCAADAQPVSIELAGNLAGGWKPDQWLEFIGTAEFPSTLGHIVPRIVVDTIKPTQEPDEPYLSP